MKFNRLCQTSYTSFLAIGYALLCVTPAHAQQADGEDASDAEIVVVGSQIRGAKVTEALPVTVVSTAEITATGAVSGDELFRSIPQFGDVRFNSQYLPFSSNAARGDIGSLDLRSLGVGNTLVLLNGRRVVNHPTSQANAQLVPVLTFNTNAIPINGLERLEVLRDGAAAIYGADAVAGVVNTVLKRDYDGAELSLQYGGAEGTGFREFNANGVIGTDFAENRGNITLFASYDRGTGLRSTEQYFTASSDRRGLFVGTPFEGVSSLDGRSTTNVWANLQTPSSFGRIQRGATALTNASGQFHIQPTSFAGCQFEIGEEVCIDDGSAATSGADRDLRRDLQAEDVSMIPRLNRLNLFLTGEYDVSDGATFFGEAGFYRSKTKAEQAAVNTLSSIPITIPANNYWNPFGPVQFDDGAANPNRIDGTNVPPEGLPVTIRNYAFVDFGPMKVKVTNQQYRLLAGIRGDWNNFSWETALSYSEAWARDVSDNISRTELNESLSLSTPDAYNVFNGGCQPNSSIGDCTPNSVLTIDAMRQDLTRYTKSTLLTYDFRVSNANLFTLPGGDVGFAGGIEARRETQLDDRDPRIDGTTSFTDPVTGNVVGDFVNTSPNLDTRGHREVFGAYGELAVPLVSPEMNVPLIRQLELQLAGRYEQYSDFGSVAVPKVAAAWDIVEGVRLRGSWAKSFRAPNLEQVNATVITRANTRTDYALCEALLRKEGRSFADCQYRFTIATRRSGNPDLDPERARTLSFGVVLEPSLPPEAGELVFTADWWRVRQTGLIGIFGDGNAIVLDYLLRQRGSSNPNVIRAEPTATDLALFAGTGLQPAGQILYSLDQYVNLLPQTVKGLDFSLSYRSPETGAGRFNLAVNASHFLKYYQEPSAGVAMLLAARETGEIDADTTVTGGGDLREQSGLPKWRGSASLTWSLGDVTVGAFAQYVGKVDDIGLTLDGEPWVVKARTTLNLYGQYRFSTGALEGTTLRLGVRNLFDKAPPTASTGYLGEIYSPVRRYWYVNVSHTF